MEHIINLFEMLEKINEGTLVTELIINYLHYRRSTICKVNG